GGLVVVGDAHEVTVALAPAALARHEAALLQALHRSHEVFGRLSFWIRDIHAQILVGGTAAVVAATHLIVRQCRIAVAYVTVLVWQSEVTIIHARQHAV